MKRVIFLFNITLLLLAFNACAPTSVKDKILSIEIRREDDKAVTEQVEIILEKGDKTKSYISTGQNYSLTITEEFPFTLKFLYTDDFLPLILDINGEYFPEGSSTGELSIILPIKKTQFYGKILDVNKQGIVGVTAKIQGDDRAYALSESDGTYHLESSDVLLNGSIIIEFTKKYYERNSLSVNSYLYRQKNIINELILKKSITDEVDSLIDGGGGPPIKGI
ncbi:MAG: hypothetical protein KAI81_09505, partial [Candidatus Marinimicrobia bacterium]|nr:hypothetical protein [Candidatus Neomarinimicrobiota bacterium]